MTEFDFDAAAGKEPAEPGTEGVLPEPDAEQPTAVFDYGAAAPAPSPEPAPQPATAVFDFDAAAGAVEVEEPPLRKITDPLGRPLKVQPPERQWSVFGTPLPGTEAAVMGAEIHPLSRAVLQNFDLTEDIPGNRAALKKILRGVYGPNIALNRAAPLPVDDLTDRSSPSMSSFRRSSALCRRTVLLDAVWLRTPRRRLSCAVRSPSCWLPRVRLTP